MSGPRSEKMLRALCWLVVVLELLFGFVILVLLGTRAAYGHSQVVVAFVSGFAPILAGCVATRNPRRASRIALWPAPLVILFLFSRLPHFSFYLPVWFIFAMATTLLPGLFWLVAARRNWPLPLSTQLFRHRPFLAASAIAGLICLLLFSSVATSFLLPWWEPIGDCGGRPLLDEDGKPWAIDFMARILFVGPKTFHEYSLFSLARVEERFANSIWDVPRFVILRDFFRPTDVGEDFFVEGKRSLGPFTRFLPVVERVECGHSCRMNNGVAIVALRTLRDIPPRNGARVIGFVATDRRNPKPASGINIFVRGPSGVTSAVTDGRGVYDVVGLPFGQYSVELSIAGATRPICALDLAKRAVGDCSFVLDEVYQPAN